MNPRPSPTAIKPPTSIEKLYGCDVEALVPGLWRVALPSLTLPPHTTTNTYVFKTAQGAHLIDAGESHPERLLAILKALGVGQIRGLYATHAHSDHLAGLRTLSQRFALPIGSYAPARLETEALPLEEQQVLHLAPFELVCHHTPGHSPDHLAFEVKGADILLCGDLLSADASTYIGVPDGNLSAYLDTLDKVAARPWRTLAPGHGALVSQAAARLTEVKAHRAAREQEVLAALERAKTIAQLRRHIYPGYPKDVHPYLEAALSAQLAKLQAEHRVERVSAAPSKTKERYIRCIVT